jgi:hypothetical protein
LTKIQDKDERNLDKEVGSLFTAEKMKGFFRNIDSHLLTKNVDISRASGCCSLGKPITKQRALKRLRKTFPVVRWLPQYTLIKFRDDVLAGISTGDFFEISLSLHLGTMMIAQCMAYALLAGLPPIYGLYSGI